MNVIAIVSLELDINAQYDSAQGTFPCLSMRTGPVLILTVLKNRQVCFLKSSDSFCWQNHNNDRCQSHDDVRFYQVCYGQSTDDARCHLDFES